MNARIECPARLTRLSGEGAGTPTEHVPVTPCREPLLAEPRGCLGVRTSTFFENMGVVIRRNVHRSSKAGVGLGRNYIHLYSSETLIAINNGNKLFWWFDSTESLKFKMRTLWSTTLRKGEGRDEGEGERDRRGDGGKEDERGGKGKGRRVPLSLHSFVVFIFTARRYARARLCYSVSSVCASVCPSLTFRYRDHTGCNTSKIISGRIV